MRTVGIIEGLGRRAVMFQANVSKEDEVQAMFARTIEEFGRLDICVPNAAIQLNARVDEMTLYQWQEVINVNLTGMFLCARESVRAFKRQGIDRSISYACGKLIFISSVHDVIPWEGHANYGRCEGWPDLVYEESGAGSRALENTCQRDLPRCDSHTDEHGKADQSRAF